MAAIKGAIGWFGRKALLYVFLVLAIIAGSFVVPWIKAEWTGPGVHLARANQLDGIRQELVVAQADAQRRLSVAADAATGKTIAELDKALVRAEEARASAESQRRGTLAQVRSFASLDTQNILSDRRRDLEIQLRSREIEGLRAARDRLNKRNALGSLTSKLQDKFGQATQLRENARRAQAACNRATKELSDFEARWVIRITFGQYQRRQHALLQSAKRSRCYEAGARTSAFQSARKAAENLRTQRSAAERAYQQSRSWTEGTIAAATDDIERRILAERTTATGSLRAKASLWAERVHLDRVLKLAGLALLVIILSPYLIRLFCYFVLAPAAMRRPAIRLRVPGGPGTAIPLAERSTTSVSVRLVAGEELLVRQDYLQSSSHAGAKGTRWFLDWRHPLTSIATGLTFLTRISGESQLATVSAVHDPFAEVTIVTLPEGSSCVLQPRALAAVVKPIRRPLRVSSHWRLRSLNAWLTMQLRYIVFHGPARLVVKGGRGVRVERAERGRIFGQAQLVGFSADLAYSVARTETFWPYFLGREQLLKDRVEAGEGVLIVEEAPMADRQAGEVKRGIEGMLDTGMKVFGM